MTSSQVAEFWHKAIEKNAQAICDILCTEIGSNYLALRVPRDDNPFEIVEGAVSACESVHTHHQRESSWEDKLREFITKYSVLF